MFVFLQIHPNFFLNWLFRQIVALSRQICTIPWLFRFRSREILEYGHIEQIGGFQPNWGWNLSLCSGGYLDSLLETAWGALTILPKCTLSWAQYIWQQRHFWAFVFSSRTVHIWAWSQLSVCSRTPTVHATTISRFLWIFSPNGPSFLEHSTIRQVIWPNPGTLATGRVGFVSTNVHIRWNSVYTAFHRIGLCGNEWTGS